MKLSSLLGYVEIPKSLFFNTSGNWFLVHGENNHTLGVPQIKNLTGNFMFNTKVESVYNTSDAFYKSFLELIFADEDIFHRMYKRPVCFFKESALNPENEDVFHDVDSSFIPACRDEIVREALKEVMLRQMVHFFYRNIHKDFLKQNFKNIEKKLKKSDFKDQAIEKLKAYGEKPTDEDFRDFCKLDYSFLKLISNHESISDNIKKAESFLLGGKFMDGVALSKRIHKEITHEMKLLENTLITKK